MMTDATHDAALQWLDDALRYLRVLQRQIDDQHIQAALLERARAKVLAARTLLEGRE